jgi:phosphoribosyl-ATP pyrophosphohydrolase
MNPPLLTSDQAGYHVTSIEKGILGTSSKILEEVQELIDAELQECRLMALLELADILGAIDAYLAQQAPSFNLEDLLKMSTITKRAFKNGYRS